MNEGSGTSIRDYSGYGHHGTLFGAVNWTGSSRGPTLNFDGTTSHVRIFLNQQMPYVLRDIGNNNDYSVTAWINTSKPADNSESYWRGEQLIISFRDEDSTSKVPLYFGITDTFLYLGRAAFDTADDENLFGVTPVNDGKWHHVAVVIRDDTLWFYLDGRLDVQRTFVSAVGDTSVGAEFCDLLLGVASRDNSVVDSNFFQGFLDDIRVYNRALQYSEIRELYVRPYVNVLQRRIYPVSGGPISGSGSLSGSSTASGVGVAVKRTSGTSTAAATVSGAIYALSPASGSSAGSSTVAGVGIASKSLSGSSVGASTVSGVGQSIATASGASVGVATVSGISASTATASGVSAGSSTVSGIGQSLAIASGTSSGSATVSATGQSIATASGLSSGTSTVSGISASGGIGVGSAAGVATVSGVGVAFAIASGSSTGIATVSGSSSLAISSVPALIYYRRLVA